MLTPYKEKLNAPSPTQSKKSTALNPCYVSPNFHFLICCSFIDRSTTPAGSPPPTQQATFGIPQANATVTPAAPAQNTSSILAALANIAKQNISTPPQNPPLPAPVNSYGGVANVQPSHAQHVPQSNQSMPVATAPVNPISYTQGQTNAAPFYPPSNLATVPNGGVPGLTGIPGLPQVAMDPAVQRQLVILKTLADQGVPQEQWGPIIAALTAAPGAAGINSPAANGPQTQNGWGSRPDESRDHNAYGGGPRSPGGGQYHGRSRSQSPSRGWGARDSPNSRRHDPYGRDVARGDDNERAGRGGHTDGYRQRSPTGRRGRSPSPNPNHMNGNGTAKKWTEYDPTIGKGNIKGTSIS